MPQNFVEVIGNLTDDPELRYTQGGAGVANFSVAVSRRVRKDGEWDQVLDGYFRVTCWRSLAENVAESLHKGDRVIVIGSLRQRSYDDSEGNKRTVVEIQASHVAPDLAFATAQLTRNPKQSASDPGDDEATEEPEAAS